RDAQSAGIKERSERHRSGTDVLKLAERGDLESSLLNQDHNFGYFDVFRIVSAGGNAVVGFLGALSSRRRIRIDFIDIDSPLTPFKAIQQLDQVVHVVVNDVATIIPSAICSNFSATAASQTYLLRV